ncbi:MAG: tetratricopeptide repeat protein, partial [Acidobacteriota bacterium]
YTIRALETITAISRPLAAGVFALSALTAPVFLLLTGFPQAAVLLLLAVGGAEGLRAVGKLRRRRAASRRLEDALARLRQNPEEAESARRVALLHLEIGNRAAALRYLEDALRKHPGRLDLHYYLARAMDMQSLHAEALLHHGTVFEQDPEYDDGRIRRELAKARIHAGDASGGARLLETYLERQPGDLEGRYRLAQARHLTSDRDAAQAQLDILRRQARSHPRCARGRDREWVIRARLLRSNA